jgi:hypothetical protein
MKILLTRQCGLLPKRFNGLHVGPGTEDHDSRSFL